MIQASTPSSELAGVVAIADAIIEQFPIVGRREVSLASGLAGEALFLGELSRFTNPLSRYSDGAVARLRAIAAEMRGREFLRPGLFSGVTGVAWVSQYLKRVLDTENLFDESSFDDIYEYIFHYLSRDVEYEYDLINGLAGIGLWALSIDSDCWRTRISDRVVSLLRHSAIMDADGLAWKTPKIRQDEWWQSQGKKEPEYNLGIAHGIPGVIGFLAECTKCGVRPDECSQMIEDSVNWLLGRTLDNDNASVFPYFAGSSAPGRLAWCYGDPGVALVLCKAACLLNSEKVSSMANYVALKAATRFRSESGVVDGSVCHGSAGLAIIFHRLFESLENPVLARASSGWLEHLISSRIEDDGIDGYLKWNGIERVYESSPSLLTGGSGIGLVLLSMSTREFDWAYPFLANP